MINTYTCSLNGENMTGRWSPSPVALTRDSVRMIRSINELNSDEDLKHIATYSTTDSSRSVLSGPAKPLPEVFQ